jgi:parallel beta-helix repeat protein
LTVKATLTKDVVAKLLIAVLLISIFGFFVEFEALDAMAESSIIYVNAANSSDPAQDGSLEHPFDTIQEAVDVAFPGDVVSVEAGIYSEYVQIKKSFVSLTSKGGAVVDGGGSRDGIRVGALPPYFADNVSITGFTVKNCVKGIFLVRCRYASFRNVTMVDNMYNFADYSLHANDVDTSNTVDGKPIYYWVNEHGKQIPENAGFVALVNCTEIIVKNLNLTRNGQGIVLKNTRDSIINNVRFSSNWDGVYMETGSRNNTIVNCVVTNNFFMGVYLSASDANTVNSNFISENEYGISLDESSSLNVILNNVIEENGYGLHFHGEYTNLLSGNIVEANTFLNNAVGISTRFSRNNLIFSNNFINNSEQVQAVNSTDCWDKNATGNYWSDYTGEDANSDGIGDAPYTIDANNEDRYPLMTVIPEYPVDAIMPLFIATMLLVAITYKRKRP